MLYLAPYIGRGTRKSPFTPAVFDENCAAIDLRADCTKAEGQCLLWIPGGSGDSRLTLIGTDKSERVARSTTSRFRRWGADIRLRRLADVLAEFLLSPDCGFYPIRPSLRGICEYILGDVWWRIRVPSGAAVLATDNFNRADVSPIGGNWTTESTYDDWKIVSNQALKAGAISASDGLTVYTGISWPNDQYSQAVIAVTTNASSAGDGVGISVRAATAAKTNYEATTNTGAANKSTIAKRVTATFTSLATSTTALAVSDTYYLEVQGTSLVAKKNGSTMSLSATDGAIAAGSAGMVWSGEASVTIGQLDSWEGGDFSGGGDTVLAQACM